MLLSTSSARCTVFGALAVRTASSPAVSPRYPDCRASQMRRASRSSPSIGASSSAAPRRRRGAPSVRTRPPASVAPRPGKGLAPRRMNRWPGSAATGACSLSWASPVSPGRSSGRFEQGQPRLDLRRAEVKEERPAPRKRRLGRGEQRELHIQGPSRGKLAFPDHHHPPPDVLRGHSGKVHRCALARRATGHGLPVGLDAPHPEGPRKLGQERHRGLRLDGAREQRSGDHGSESLDGERPVDGEEERTIGRTAGHCRRRPSQRRAQGVQPLAGPRRDGNHLCLLEHAPGKQRRQVRVEQRPPVVAEIRQEVCLGQRDHPGSHPEKLTDVEVLAGLRHDALVRGDDQDGQVDPARAGDHGLDEALVPRDVDHARRRPSGKLRWAKPSSMVMPRRFSSGSRSVSMPVSALTSDVLPWSMCPAVPTITPVTGGAERRARAPERGRTVRPR